MSDPERPDAIRASCYNCETETLWEPASQQQYHGFVCTMCGTFQQGGMFDEAGVWWENRGGELRRKA